MAATRVTLRLVRALNAQLAGVTDAQVRDLVAAWADAWDEIAPDLNAALVEQLVAGERVTRRQMLRSLRLQAALQVIASQLQDLAAKAGVRITADLDDVIDTAGAAQASIIDSQLPAGYNLVQLDSWARVDPDQIAAMVARSTEQITSLTRPLAADAYQAVRLELIRGVAAGSNPRATAARIVDRAQGRFNGGLTRALNIARTETLDAHRAAAQVSQAAHADVLAGWRWVSALDARTCPSCWAQHGTLHDLDVPGPDDHQQGRCARVPVPRPWSDLGVDVEEPPSLIPDAGDTFEALPSEQQLAILGPARYRAWMAGDFPMGSWSVRRSNDGWRDSHTVAPVPAGYRPGQSGGRVSRSAA
ncbi:phage minor head protein [Nocardioides bruguierae]|uniref:phage minor head protein n=1 Tax=Nocardioides bruguierae TaxID=2945102 RepID=UPI00201FB4C0|nr:phage minor head protein [Nocardioides bruguierae]MCL8026323.1 phage head morphogenesis protein [Nocardioides bruguierae]